VTLGRLPRRFSYRVMTWVADMIARFFPDKLQGLRANLRQVFPDATDEELDRLVRRNVRNYAKFWVDLFRVPRIHAAARERFVNTTGEEHLHAVLAGEKGCIVVSIHMGAWEGCAGFWARTRSSIALIAEVLEPPFLWRRVRALRESTGLDIIPLGRSAPREILRRLRDNGIVVAAMDRDIMRTGRPYEFFGRTLSIPAGVVDVAQRTGAGILPVLCLRRPDDDFRVAAYPPVWVSPEPGGVDRAVASLLRTFEGWVREYPDQWHVMEPLWKTGATADQGNLVTDLEAASLG
jgi:KDO2-lipid IV(A) lauroyltransferase